MSDFGSELRRLMAARGIGVRELARQTHYTPGHISNLCNGKKQPSPEAAERFDHMLRADGQLAATAGTGRTRASQPRSARGEPLALPPVNLLDLAWIAGRIDRPLDRKGVQGLAATLHSTPGLGLADPADRLSYALAHSARGLPEQTLNYLGTVTLGLHWLEFVIPAGQIIGPVLTHLHHAISLLEACGDDKARRRLAATLGETALLGAWAAWDLGDIPRAISLYRAAEDAAAEGGDRAITACAVIYQSLAATGARGHAQARERLASAAALPGRSDAATRAWLAAREAEEAAALGDPCAQERIKAAADLLAASRPLQERSWTRCLEPSQVTHARLSVATRLGDQASVHRCVGDLMPRTSDPQQKRTGRMLATIGIAFAAIGDTQEAVRIGWRSIEAIGVSKATYALNRLAELGAALDPSAHMAQELCQAISLTRRELGSARPSTPGNQPARP